MSDKYKFKNPAGVYFVTLTVVNWVGVFTRSEYKDILIENLDWCQKNKGLDIYAWCVMTNHVHLIVGARTGYLLEGIMRDYKKFTSKAIKLAIIENPQESRREWLLDQFNLSGAFRLWQSGNHPIELWSNKVINQKLNYVHQNPVEAGVVFKAEDYRYSSAYDYAGGKGLLEVILI